MNDKERIIQLVAQRTGLLPSVVRVCLEAAAPHMLAEAWRTGCIEGLTTDFGLEADVLASNPYRSAK